MMAEFETKAGRGCGWRNELQESQEGGLEMGNVSYDRGSGVAIRQIPMLLHQ